MNFANLLLSFTLSQLPQYPPLPPMPPVIEAEALPPPKKAPQPTYEETIKRSLAEGLPIVFGVQCVPVVPTGFLGLQGVFEDEAENTIVVVVPINGKLRRVPRLFAPGVSVGTIRHAVSDFMAEQNRKAVRLSPSPFSQEALVALDADPVASGHWPKDLEFPKEMKPYYHASYTQRIAVTNDRDTITPVSRKETERKWQVPGGLEFADNWSSALYKYVPGGSTDWVGNIEVANGIISPYTGKSFTQYNRGWKRSYPVGSYFCDVLTNNKTGKVFEVRYREKTAAGWENTVAYRSVLNRPLGFHRLSTRECIQCHNTTNGAGSGGYAVGLVPGGDTIISDPFPALER